VGPTRYLRIADHAKLTRPLVMRARREDNDAADRRIMRAARSAQNALANLAVTTELRISNAAGE